MTFWDTLQERQAWGASLLLKSGMLGLGILVVLWAGWPQPQMASLDHSSSPIRLSESTTIQEVHHELMPVSSVSKNELLKSSTEKRKKIELQAARVPLLVDLNLSSQMELKTLPGIGNTLAARIVAYRATHGRFQRIDDLGKVSGIGEKRLRRIEPFVTVQAIVGDIGS